MNTVKASKKKNNFKFLNGFFSNLLRYAFLLSFAYVLVYPMLYIVINSFKNPADYFNPAIQWVLTRATFSNIKMAYEAMDFGNAFLSTMQNGIVTAMIQVFSCSVAAFGLARFNFKGKKLLIGSMILSILVPVMMLLIPSYVNFRNLSILGTSLVFWLPSATCVGLNCGIYIYIYNQFFKGFPKEIEEAAWIDGAGTWKTFLKIVVPSSKVSYITVTVFSVVWNWNDYYMPQMYLSSNYPISVKLANLSTSIVGWINQYYGDVAKLNVAMILISGCLLSVVPLLVFYLVIQRKFISSVVTSGIVG